MARVAAVDLGTNSFLCLVAEVDSLGQITVLSDEIEVVRLGEGVHKTRAFSKEALERANSAFVRFSKTIKGLDVTKVLACATSAARDAKNSEDLFAIGKKNQIPIQIISGEKEAELTFNGVVSGLKKKKGAAIIDVGGGSTEIIFETPKGLFAQSWDVGCVRLTEMFIKNDPPMAAEVTSIFELANEKINFIPQDDIEDVVASAGTPTTLAALSLDIEFDREKVEGFVLTREQIDIWIDRLKNMNQAQRVRLKGLDEKRADVLLTGAILLRVGLDKLQKNKLTVSTRGLRYGLAQTLAQA